MILAQRSERVCGFEQVRVFAVVVAAASASHAVLDPKPKIQDLLYPRLKKN